MSQHREDSRTGKLSMARQRMIGFLLCIAAVLMLVLAWQCVSTEQFRLYQRNYDSYAASAAEYAAYLEKSSSEQSSLVYGNLAERWMEKTNFAKTYLVQHIVGAVSLVIVSLLSMALGVRSLLAVKREEQKLPPRRRESEEKQKKEA